MTDPSLLYVVGQLTRGGAEQQLYNLLSHLTPGMTVASLSPGGYWATPLRELGHRVIELQRQRRGDVRRAWQVARQIMQRQPDIVHVFIDGISGLYGRVGALLAGHDRVVVGERNHPTHHPDWYRRMLPWLNRRVAAVVCNSYAARDYLVERRMVSAAKSHVIPNGLDVAHWLSLAANGGGFPWPEGWQGKTVVGMVARLKPQKNPQMFIRLAARVCQQRPGVRFALIGDGPLRSELAALSDSLGVAGCVWLAGERTDVPVLLGAMDMFVLTSRYEGTPNAIMEAMAAGLPCVATDAGDSRYVVADQETGFIVPVGDEAALAARVLDLAGDDTLRARLGQQGQDRIRTEFDIRAMVARYRDLYAQVLSD
jgi:glycosyltransferase involved in cell wall biosynthesis